MAVHIGAIASLLLSCLLLIFLWSYEADNYQRFRRRIRDSLIFQESSQAGHMKVPHSSTGDRSKGTVPSFPFRRPTDPETLESARAAHMLELALLDLKDRIKQRCKRDATVTEFVTLEEVELVMNRSGCPRPTQPSTCPTDCRAQKYRTISGVCNNREHPHWGVANIALTRWLPAQYEDGESCPRGWHSGHLYNGFTLPPVREVSNTMMQNSRECTLEDELYSQMLVDWGQYIDHDISFTPQSTNKTAFSGQPDCLITCENTNPCFPIKIITFRDYIPKILGPEAFASYIGVYRGYDSSVNPTTSNVFATAAFRFGHSTVSPVLRRLNESFQEHELYPSLSLHQTFFSPWRLLEEGGLDPVLRGMLGTAAVAMTPDHLMTEELTQRLVVLSSPGAVDLIALNLQRGRDHGLAGYNDWREFCGLDKVETFTDLTSVISDPGFVKKLMDLYRHPSNIDVWLGGVAEDPLPGARVGPLFACLIGKQMKFLRDGDRFWWENDSVFTEAQGKELQRHSLSRVICDNSGVKDVPLDPFRKGQYPLDYLSCKNIPKMNLEAWRDNAGEVLQACSPPTTVENGEFEFCSTSGKVTLLYSCHHGYRLEGPQERVCTETGWSGQPPVCKYIKEHDSVEWTQV